MKNSPDYIAGYNAALHDLASQRPRVERIIAGCLKSSIAAHGPIVSAGNRSSAAKRCVQELKAFVRTLYKKEVVNELSEEGSGISR